jgi:carbohydrate diacid regulator
VNFSHMPAAAQEIIDAVAPLVSGRTINIMDTEGIIIASTDPKRIGTFHQGAAEAVQKCQNIHIYPEELPHYAGAKEGINMPIVKNDHTLGVVGIYGLPEEVEEAANLLQVYVSLAIDMIAMNKTNQLKKELRLRLLQQMVHSEDLNHEEIISQAQEISVELKLPIRVVSMIAIQSKTSKLPQISALDRLEGLLINKGLIDTRNDIYGVLNERLIILKYAGEGLDAKEFLQNMNKASEAESSFKISAAIGGTCQDWTQIKASYHESLFLCQLNNQHYCDLENNTVKVEYLMNNVRSEPIKRFITPMYEILAKGFGSNEIDWIMETIQAYCNSGFNAALAAENLYIHKNTLIYRINKILSLLGLENEQSFTKEFFLKMLLLHHKRS